MRLVSMRFDLLAACPPGVTHAVCAAAQHHYLTHQPATPTTKRTSFLNGSFVVTSPKS